MIVFPAIDLFDGQAVRLYKGDYKQMTVYDSDPVNTLHRFLDAGADHVHIVDLQGAKDGGTPNYDTIKRLASVPGAFMELGGGIRSMDVIERYLDAGVDRLILGTAAVTDPDFTAAAAERFGEHIAVGADIKDGYVAIKGWLEKSELSTDAFFEKMTALGISTCICTDISRDGAMQGTNRELYRDLNRRFGINIIASGGVSSMDDINALKAMGLYGAIIGKAYYTGAIDLRQAVDACREG